MKMKEAFKHAGWQLFAVFLASLAPGFLYLIQNEMLKRVAIIMTATGVL
jgi:hypothetical protein